MRESKILGEYLVFLDFESAKAVLGHIRHTRRDDSGVQWVNPVGHFSAHIEPADDVLCTHWVIDLSLSSGFRYNPRTHETTFVANPEDEAGDNHSMLQHIKQLRDGDLPFYHAELPKQVGVLLLGECSCTEPAVVTIHHSLNEGFVAFRDIFHKDDCDD